MTLVVLPLLLLVLSLCVGRLDVGPGDVLRILAAQLLPIHRSWTESLEIIVVQIRLPRALLAMCVGAGLSISGAAFQGMFRNPLVSPDVLGVSAASGFGAALAILLSRSALELQILAFTFGLLGVAITYALARTYQMTPILMLVLSGVVVAAFFSALLSAAKLVADPENKLPAITYWLLGSFNAATLRTVAIVVPAIAAGTIGLLLVSWKLNLLSMGDEEARALGVRTEQLKIVIVVCTTLITAAAVSTCGVIGWVGLVMPHVARTLVGPDHRRLLPAALSVGASYVLAIDAIARTAAAVEIPIGILTASMQRVASWARLKHPVLTRGQGDSDSTSCRGNGAEYRLRLCRLWGRRAAFSERAERVRDGPSVQTDGRRQRVDNGQSEHRRVAVILL
ncbi:MAG TPA: iron ABC transporter permease [Vicinamibacterales bacterium]|nr:iron ABC transporter permease [Vicinamibacterales bacterium]